MTMDCVSIILTTHNGVDTIYRCLMSAVLQDYPFTEIIVVDDNGEGTKNQRETENIVRSFDNEKVKYIAHPHNKNGSAARNTGILNSKGDYIAFLDDDDVLTPDSISLRVKAFHAGDDNVGVSLGSFVQFVDGTEPLINIVKYNGKVTKDLLCLKYSTPSSIIMIRRKVIDKIGLWDESFKRHQDWEFLTRASKFFDFCSTEIIICERYVTWRNNPKLPKQFKELRLYFLYKMKSIIYSLTKKEIKEIFFVHYFDIGKQYLKHKRVFSAFFWFCKSGRPLLCLTKLFKGVKKNA